MRSRLSISVSLPILGALVLGGGCSFDWDGLDPRGATMAESGSSSSSSSASAGGSGQGGAIVELCGNGTLDPEEACDDGNRDGGDGCSADCAIECEELLDPSTLHCYAVRATEVSEPDAAEACAQLGPGWTLGAISSADELTWLSARDAINEVFAQSPFIWLGGSDAATEDTFVWNNGETPFPRELFIPGQPDNNGNEDCVDFWRTSVSNYGLNDDRCSRAFPYLCERAPAGR